MNEPAVLLVDEPTSALDHERGAAVIDLTARLTRRQASATVLVTHDRTHLSAAERIADVHGGRLRPSAGACPATHSDISLRHRDRSTTEWSDCDA
ncbi:hypothetical protein GCM10023257_55270 [Streptomyces hyderabadensis]|uniref:Uncharacterized protein n=1 Tax=Streptomyces hyderabadensis TaxID=598549 RepID=A0ABP9IMP6_9ACTN